MTTAATNWAYAGPFIGILVLIGLLIYIPIAVAAFRDWNADRKRNYKTGRMGWIFFLLAHGIAAVWGAIIGLIYLYNRTGW